MKSNVVFEYVRLFNIQAFGKGCRFGIKVSSKKQDGTYTKGVFISCKHNQMLQGGIDYKLQGFFGDNEWNERNTLELIVMRAEIMQNGSTAQVKGREVPVEVKNSPLPEVDVDIENSIPF